MSEIDRDEIDPRWLEPHDPAAEVDPRWSLEDRRALERAKGPGLVSTRPPQAGAKRDAG